MSEKITKNKVKEEKGERINSTATWQPSTPKLNSKTTKNDEKVKTSIKMVVGKTPPKTCEKTTNKTKTIIKVGFIASLSKATGNCSTAKRIAAHLNHSVYNNHSIRVILADIDDFANPFLGNNSSANQKIEGGKEEEKEGKIEGEKEGKMRFDEWVERNDFDVVIGLHAFRAGLFFSQYFQLLDQIDQIDQITPCDQPINFIESCNDIYNNCLIDRFIECIGIDQSMQVIDDHLYASICSDNLICNYNNINTNNNLINTNNLIHNNKNINNSENINKKDNNNNNDDNINNEIRKRMKIKKMKGRRFAMILGGTDVNEDIKSPCKLSLMQSLCLRVHSIVAFSSPMRASALSVMEIKDEKKVRVINPSVEEIKIADTMTSSSSRFSLREKLQIGEGDFLFLLPCGIRPVKNPLFLFPFFSSHPFYPFSSSLPSFDENNNNINNNENNINENNKNENTKLKNEKKRKINLVIVGPELEREYAEEMHRKIAENPHGNIKYHPDISKEEMIIAMKECDALINSSNSEGLANVLLEAMQLRVPVIARKIPGNFAVIRHNENGFLFDNCEEFKNVLAEFFELSTERREMILDCAYREAISLYSCDLEKSNYLSLIGDLLGL